MKQLLAFCLASLPFLSAADPATVSFFLKIDQFGYRPADPKVAVVSRPAAGSYSPPANLQLRRAGDDAVVYTGAVQAWKNGNTHTQSGDKVWWFDFSTVTSSGSFYVYDPVAQLGSHTFRIEEDVYAPVLRTAVRALFYQRCGAAVQPAQGGAWTHPVCHAGPGQDLDCRLVTGPSAANALNLSGGWHDAGDYNKYVNFTYSTLHNLLFAYQENPAAFADDLGIPESGNGVPDLLDEIKYELDWLLRMQQPDGSVLSKVSVTDFQSASPPNADSAPRYYSKASTSATLTVAGIFAQAYLVFKDKPALAAYAAALKTQAEKAWAWAEANPNVSGSNSGFQSADPEVSDYDRLARKTGAAAFLFAATGKASYKQFFENNYTEIHPYQWTYFYAFEGTYGDILLFYSQLPGITPVVGTNIRSRFNNSTNNAGDFFPAVTGQNDAYRAYLKDDDYVWGSNQIKSLTGVMYTQMVRYQQSPANQAAYNTAALDYLHYLHGANALGIVMLSNVKNIGADSCATQIYHGWTGDGTAWDKNPVPGLVPGGVNKNYSGSNTWFADKTVQKKYLDWNTSWPENSWEITEPAIYYQAAYIRLLSKFIPAAAPVAVQEPDEATARPLFSIFPNPAGEQLQVLLDETPAAAYPVRLNNAAGRTVIARQLDAAGRLDVSGLVSGTYALTLYTPSGERVLGTRFVVVQRIKE